MAITSGVMVNIHYCMGKPFLVDYGVSHHNDCDQCGMDKKPAGCCHTEHHLIKSDQPHLSTHQAGLDAPLAATLPSETVVPAALFRSGRNAPWSGYHSPPDGRGNSLYIHHCVFRV